MDISGIRTENQLKYIENKEQNNHSTTKKKKNNFKHTYLETLVNKTSTSSEQATQPNHGQNTSKTTISKMPRNQNFYQSLAETLHKQAQKVL